MDRNWEDFSEHLEIEIKKEIAENYYEEKVYLEERWKEYEEILKELKDLKEKLSTEALRIILLLNDSFFIKELEKEIKFPLYNCAKESPYWEKSREVQEELLKELILPFAFTKKGKFKKAVFKAYERFYQTLKEYQKKFREAASWYKFTREDTEAFHKNFDIATILNFFSRLDSSAAESAEDKAKVWEELSKSLRLPIPKPPEEEFPFYELPPEPKKVKTNLFKIAELYFKKHPQEAKEKLEKLC